VTVNLTAVPHDLPAGAGEILLRTGARAAGVGPWEGVIARGR
jgi:hypothetical protein